MRSSFRLAVIGAIALILAFVLVSPPSGHSDSDLEKLQADPGQWVTAGKDYALTRYSELDKISTSNVKDLGVSWTFSTGVLRGHEGTPLVVGATMYIVTPIPNIV